MALPTALDDYEFDLRGYLVIPSALSGDEVAGLNAAYERFPPLGHADWYGNAQRRDYTADTGFELHNVLDCGDPTFDVLIDHPSWIDHARRYAGESGTYVEGVTIDEHIATIRGAGGHHPVHSGGHDASVRTQYSYRKPMSVTVGWSSCATGRRGRRPGSATAAQPTTGP